MLGVPTEPLLSGELRTMRIVTVTMAMRLGCGRIGSRMNGRLMETVAGKFKPSPAIAFVCLHFVVDLCEIVLFSLAMGPVSDREKENMTMHVKKITKPAPAQVDWLGAEMVSAKGHWMEGLASMVNAINYTIK